MYDALAIANVSSVYSSTIITLYYDSLTIKHKAYLRKMDWEESTSILFFLIWLYNANFRKYLKL